MDGPSESGRPFDEKWTIAFWDRPLSVCGLSTFCRFRPSTFTQDRPPLCIWTVRFHSVGSSTFTSTCYLLKHLFSKVLIHFIGPRFPPVKKFFNMKPFGITIHKEIDNLQMDLIHQVLRDYKLKGRRKF